MSPVIVVAPFCEPLTVVHALSSETMPCPRGVLVTIPVEPGEPGLGSYRRVKPCGLERSHGGACEPSDRLVPGETVCGLVTTAAPWVEAPDDVAKCPECFGLSVPDQGDLFGATA